MDNTDYRSGYRPLPIKCTDMATIWPHGLRGEAFHPAWQRWLQHRDGIKKVL